MTEVIKDVDVMPVDPAENLPLAMTHRPAILNGRLTALGAAVRRRQLAAKVQANGTAATLRLPVEIGALVDDSQSKADGVLLNELSVVLDRKEALLRHLQDMNQQAEAGRHLEPGTNKPTEEFQTQYASVLATLQALNGELQGLLSKLQSRPQLTMLAPAAVAAAGQSTGLLPLPAATVAAQAAATVQQAVASSRLGVLGLKLEASYGGGAVGPVSNMVASPLVSGGIPKQGSSSQQPGQDVTRLVLAAMSEARALVKRYRPVPESANASQHEEMHTAATAAAAAGSSEGGLNRPDAGETAAAGAGDAGLSGVAGQGTRTGTVQTQSEEQGLIDDVITHCVAMLFTLQKCTSTGPGGAVLSPAFIEAALDSVLAGLKPRSEGNVGVFQQVASSVATLKAQLAWAY